MENEFKTKLIGTYDVITYKEYAISRYDDWWSAYDINSDDNLFHSIMISGRTKYKAHIEFVFVGSSNSEYGTELFIEHGSKIFMIYEDRQTGNRVDKELTWQEFMQTLDTLYTQIIPDTEYWDD